MNFEPIIFQRRLGSDPHDGGAKSPGLNGCPDVWELGTGDFAVIGIDITDRTAGKLPATAGCGPDERVVWVPRKTLVAARSDIPTEL